MIVSLFLWFNLISYCNASNGEKPPNILFIMFDDLGFSDISYNGGKYPTPNIDNLFNNGINLKRHYSHLLCSTSRSQYLTGRYAMYMGQGAMKFYTPRQLASIPLGLPTIASWLKLFKNYHTFGIGKWHLGYSINEFLPNARGFDHFFGYYTGMLSYTSFESVELKRYDLHEDGFNYNYDQLLSSNLLNENEPNALYLYRNKALQYIENEAQTNKDGAFYLYLAMQSPHGPLATITKYEDICENILQSERNAKLTDVEHRKKYCQVMLLSDDIIGDIINSLKVNDLYDNTLILLTTDNGGDIANTGCNFPLRGTKATMFEGNTRTLAVISGGVIPSDQYHTIRKSLFSSLDWTPTLLDFAGIYDEITENDRTWDGTSQYDLIMYGDHYSQRDHIVFNIGLRNLESATIVFNYNNKLYKYMASDRSINPENFVDERIRSWCVPNDENNVEYFVIDSKTELLHYPDRFNDRYWLFNLDDDESEYNNIFMNNSDHNVNIHDIVDYAKSLLNVYVEHPLYSEHIKRLFMDLKIDEKLDDVCVDTFLTKKEYLDYINIYLDVEENKNNNPISSELRQLYTVPWKSPKRVFKSNDQISISYGYYDNFVDVSKIIFVVLIFLTFVFSLFCCWNKKTNSKISEHSESYGTFS